MPSNVTDGIECSRFFTLAAVWSACGGPPRATGCCADLWIRWERRREGPSFPLPSLPPTLLPALRVPSLCFSCPLSCMDNAAVARPQEGGQTRTHTVAAGEARFKEWTTERDQLFRARLPPGDMTCFTLQTTWREGTTALLKCFYYKITA